ncbi:MAG TPA: hypothetical protein VF821_26325, partial [Lentzea sp.]
EVYLRKWIHDVQASGSLPSNMGTLTNPAQVLAVWNTGAGPHSVVPVSPSTGAQGGPWVFETHLFTHQLRKGKKKKVVKASSVDLLKLLQELGAAAGTGAAIAELLGALA